MRSRCRALLISILVLMTGPALAASSGVAAPATMSAQDYDFYAGDFNGDGYTDLLYIAKDPSNLSGIILSDGTNLSISFQSWGNSYLGIPWSSGLYNVIVADFNGDGRADILLQRKTPGDSYLLITGDTGVVAISQTIPEMTSGVAWSADQHTIVAGDFDGDGKADVFLQSTTPSGLNAVVLADTNGQFTASAPAQSWNDGYLGFNWATSEALVFAGDFNGDGHADLLIQAEPQAGTGPGTSQPANFPPNLNGVVLAQPGPEIFAPAGVQAWSQTAFGADWSPLDSVVVIGDFNGDGRADVLLQAMTAYNTTSLLHGNSAGPIFSGSTTIDSSVLPSASDFVLLPGHFDGSQGAGLFMQGRTPAQSNYLGHISGSVLIAAVQIPAAPSTATVSTASPTVTTSLATASTAASGTTLAVTSAGRTAGQFSITPTGGTTYNIPLWTPPGARGIEPHLALHYLSGGPDGVMGPGWSLTGLSAIVRCNKTWAANGAPSAVTLSTSDDLCLDGNRLRVTSGAGTQGMGGSTYLAELADFSLVIAGGSASSPLSYFTVKGKDGRYYEYGNTADSKITASGASAPYMWMLDKVYDRQGNNMVFAYAGGTSATLSSIQYTGTPGTGAGYGYKVTFTYAQRTGGTSITKYVAGFAASQSQELTNINITSAGTSVRQYNIIHAASPTTNRPLVQSVQECGGSAGTDCLRATTLTYQSGAAGWSTTASATGLNGQYGFLPIDLNGDGIPDALYGKPSGSNTHWYAKIATTSGFGSTEFDTGVTTTPGETLIPGAFSGRAQMQFLAPVGTTWYVYTFTGTGFSSASTGVTVNGEYLATDYDGDGLPDLVGFANSGTVVTARRNTTAPGGAVTFSSTTTTVYTGSSLRAYQYSLAPPMDFNGDGRADLLVQEEICPRGGCIQVYTALISNGFSVAATSIRIGNIYLAPQVGDWNGDGCTDVIAVSAVYISNCASGFSQIATGTNSSAIQPIAVDWDGDGQTDLIYIDSSSKTWYMVRSTGAGAAAPVSLGIPAPLATGQIPLQSLSPIDMNSDGQPDLAFVDDLNGYAIKYYPHSGANLPPDLISTVSDGFGISFSPTYVSLTHGSYTKGAAATFPDEDFQGPMYVVAQFSASDGIGGTYQNTFSYTGARLNLQGRGFEGFATTQSYDSRNGIYRKNTYRQDFPYTGSVSEFDEYQSNDSTLIAKTTNTYAQNELVSNTSGYSQAGSVCTLACFPYAKSTTAYHYEVGGTKNGVLVATDVTNYTYDAFGTLTNTASTTTDNDSATPPSPFYGQSWSTTIANTIVNDTTNWCLGRPSLSKTTKTAPGEPSLTRTVSHSIDSVNCRANNEVVEPSDPRLQVTTTFAFDACGNTKSVSVVGLDQNGSAMPARTTTTSYGTRCQLPESVTNPLGQITQTAYRYDLGLKSSVTDPNNLLTTWTYDNFGRLTQETRPDGTYSTRSYTDCVASSCWGAPDLRFETVEYLWSSSRTQLRHRETFADGLDRLRYDEINRVQGVWTVTAYTYDSLGRKTEAVLPYSSSSNGYHIISYDLADRPTADKLYTSSGALYRTISMAYAGQTATVTDPNLNTTTKVTDVSGKLRSVTDPAVSPNPAGTTAYTYDVFGNLVKIVDAIGATSTYTYNVRGFKTGALDADTGSWSFTPDSLNELVSQKDAKGQVTSFVYDLLGRMTSRLEPESTTPTTWVYGTSATSHNIGQLQSLSKPDGYAEQYAYDSDGRLQTKIITEDGTNYQYDYGYNTNGTLDTLTYPTSTSGYRFKLQYVYDSWGYLNSVKDASAGTAFWTLTTADDASMPTLELLGNAVQVSTGYTPWTNEMTSRTEGSGGSTTNLQNLSYSWDPTGNLQQRVDNRQGLTEVFAVDHMNRLSTVTLNGTQTLAVTYDQAGDIKTKSDVGTYTYGDSAHPHAVTAAGTWTISYDANGNMASRAGGAITSYSYNLPNQINYNGSSSQFNYDADHQRWKQVANYAGAVETVHYIGGLLQVVNRGGVTEYRHQIPAGSSTAIYTRRSDGTNSTYYATSDHLGSADLVMDSAANVLARESFGPFGARRGSNWQGLPTTADYSAFDTTTRQGFTGHEMLDTVSLVHMNGRVYDPTLGRFLSADTVIQSLGATQSINPYSYAWNDPLRFIDPSGHSIWGLIAGVLVAAALFEFLPAFLVNAAGLTVAQAQIAAVAISGFAGGFVGAAVSTGSLSAALVAGVEGMITAEFFNAAGSFAQIGPGANWEIYAQSAIAHAVVGCVSGEMSSGNCGQAALAAAISDVASPSPVNGSLGFLGAARLTAEAGLVGGIAADIEGGKFEDGFSVSAAGYLFSQIGRALDQRRNSARASGSENRPDLEALAKSPAVARAIDAAWTASNPDGPPDSRMEHGFWILSTGDGAVSVQQFSMSGANKDTMFPGPTPSVGLLDRIWNFFTGRGNPVPVAFFHTHPNPANEGWYTGPSPADISFAQSLNLPGIIQSTDGMYFFGPPLRMPR